LHATQSIPVNDLRRGALDHDLTEVVSRVVASGWYLLGEETAAFESELADYLGADHVVGVASGTDALELACVSLGAGPGQEIVTAANAGGYGAMAAYRCGMSAHFADVDDRDLVLTPDTVEAALTRRTTMVIVTHLYGKMAPVAEICELCHAKGVLVIEDCAQAAGARADGRYAGSVGDAAAFSFYPTKNLGALGDAGAVVTSDDSIAARARRLRQYGWDVKYRIEDAGGRNSRLDEIQAAVLRARLPRLDDMNRRRREIAREYADALAATSVRMAQSGDDDYVAHLAVIRTTRRAAFARALGERGVGTDTHYPIPDHRQRFIGDPWVKLPVTEAASEQVLSLPCFPELAPEEVEIICAALAEVAEAW
jgi:dTDP-3-amino-2,3,6-trideoxy-4-keto-D-glucose/dTDP-3-amino-3,4,6-trideoxy-alpha-D-glucose/dTDP-2,6-dideoxy-D-kanosamine transaminase